MQSDLSQSRQLSSQHAFYNSTEKEFCFSGGVPARARVQGTAPPPTPCCWRSPFGAMQGENRRGRGTQRGKGERSDHGLRESEQDAWPERPLSPQGNKKVI